MSSRIQISYGKNEALPANIFTDLQWVEENLAELFQVYGRCTVIVYEKEILGIGASIEEALNKAELAMSNDIKKVTAIVADIRHPERVGLVVGKDVIESL